jgi:hypothetical protein
MAAAAEDDADASAVEVVVSDGDASGGDDDGNGVRPTRLAHPVGSRVDGDHSPITSHGTLADGMRINYLGDFDAPRDMSAMSEVVARLSILVSSRVSRSSSRRVALRRLRTIRGPVWGGVRARARLASLSARTGEQTRTAIARAVVPNFYDGCVDVDARVELRSYVRIL